MPAAVIGGALSAAGGIGGGLSAAAQREKALELQQQAMQNINSINAPTPEEQKVIYQKLQSAGQLTPAMEAAINQGQSQMAGISTDPRLAQAQMGALAKLQQVGNEGMTAEDRNALAQINRSNAIEDQGRQGAILQNMAARGQGGSGAELAVQLASSQNATNNAAQQGMGVAAQAQNRALQALSQYGNMAGNIRGQSFGEQSAQAQAQDAINSYNARNQQNVANSNVSAQNSAQAQNLANAQRISDTNANLTNQQNTRNADLYQQQFTNRLNQANSAASATKDAAAGQAAAAQRTADTWSGVGNAANTAVNAAFKNPSASGGSPTADEFMNTDNANKLKQPTFGAR